MNGWLCDAEDLSYNFQMLKAFLVFATFCSGFSYGARKLEVPLAVEDTGSYNIINVLIENPSTVSQTVDINLKSRGSMRLRAASAVTDDNKADGAIECALTGTIYNCNLASSKRVIAPGNSLQLRVRTELTVSNTDRDINTGIIATVTVAENTGYLVGTVTYTVGSTQSYVHAPFAGGRPF